MLMSSFGGSDRDCFEAGNDFLHRIISVLLESVK